MTEEAEKFWRDYSEKLGEKILRFALGQYLSGADGLSGPLWGLAIVTDGGLRFHHFPHENWLSALTRVGGSSREAPAEKTFFVPKARIVGYELKRETSLLRRILFPAAPRLVVRYRPEGAADGTEPAVLQVELDRDAVELAASLAELLRA